MKRKKPPVALISFLVISLLGLVIFSKSFAFYNKTGEEQQQELQKQAQEAAQANAIKPPETKSDASAEVKHLKDAMKHSPNGTSVLKPTGPDGDMQPKHARQPTVLMPSEEIRKPTQNTSAPSSQWYGAGK
jgi:type II secretory pathway pseudopilin PulG